jgi:DNA polymerase
LGRDLRSAQYLEALGLESWVLRRPAAPLAMAASSPLPPPPPVPVPGRVAGLAADWRALAEEVAVCVRCRLHERRTQTVFGVGDPGAELLVIGEAPGADEDRQVGRSSVAPGNLLTRCCWPQVAALGVYIASIIKCQPPDNRDPCPSALLHRPPLNHLLGPRLMLAVRRSPSPAPGTNTRSTSCAAPCIISARGARP